MAWRSVDFEGADSQDLKQELAQWVYVGDSTNDQVMFEHFTHSVGMATSNAFKTS
jgi:hydroxymethylpyrimidine pyrophosphatase-like HAD family hydrolase